MPLISRNYNHHSHLLECFLYLQNNHNINQQNQTFNFITGLRISSDVTKEKQSSNSYMIKNMHNKIVHKLYNLYLVLYNLLILEISLYPF